MNILMEISKDKCSNMMIVFALQFVDFAYPKQISVFLIKKHTLKLKYQLIIY